MRESDTVSITVSVEMNSHIGKMVQKSKYLSSGVFPECYGMNLYNIRRSSTPEQQMYSVSWGFQSSAITCRNSIQSYTIHYTIYYTLSPKGNFLAAPKKFPPNFAWPNMFPLTQNILRYTQVIGGYQCWGV